MAKPANCPANTGGPCKGQRAPAALLKPDGSDRRGAGGGRSKGEARGHPPKKKKRPWDSGAPSLRWTNLMISYFSLAHAREKVLLQNRGISVTDSVTESPIRLASQYGRYG